jgi:hypothetical protein
VLMKILQVYACDFRDNYILHDLKFSQHFCWRLQFFGVSCHVGWYFVTDILEELAASVFRVVQQVYCLDYYPSWTTLNMEAGGSSKLLVTN